MKHVPANPTVSRRDPLPLIFGLLGFALMCGTILFRINPVEGSVVPDFFHETFVGNALYWLMFVTCMPVFILTTASVNDEMLAWLPAWLPAFNLALLVMQVFLYWLLGKTISMLCKKGQHVCRSKGKWKGVSH